jgi:hypothetical protein
VKLPSKMAHWKPCPQLMALIALSVIGCIDYLAYGTMFTRAMFQPKNKLMFFPPKNPKMSIIRQPQIYFEPKARNSKN